MTSPTALRLAARLARREVRRRPWRTLLVALLVAIPVAGMTMAAAFVRTDRYDERTAWRQTWGSSTDLGFTALPADQWQSREDAPDVDGVLATLPPGSRTTIWRTGHATFRTLDKERSSAQVFDLPLSGGFDADIVQILRGRAPSAAGEAFLTRTLADDLGVDIGDTLDLERPARLSWRVVGVGEQRAYWGSTSAYLAPGTPFPWDSSTEVGTAVNYAIDLPQGVTRADVRAVLEAFPVAPAPQLGWRPTYSESNTDSVAWSWVIGGIVLTVVGIVIASAFAAGARRQLTTVGQLAANGAAPAVVRGVLFLQGTWTGALGALLGLGLGGLGLAALAPHADRMLSRDVDPWELRVLDLVPVVLLGVGAATVAALIPARTTARIPVLAALAGRRPLSKVPRWVTGMGALVSLGGLGLLGLAVLGGGDATHDTQLWALTAVLGGMGVLLGACAMTPGYTSALEPLGARLQGSWRLAARSLARQRTRTSAVVSGVCAASALAVGAAALVLSMDAEVQGRQQQMRADEVHLSAETMTESGDRSNPQFTVQPTPAPRELVDTVTAALPGADVLELTTVRVPEGMRWQVEQEEFARGQSASGDFMFNFRPNALNAVVFDEIAARVYDLRPSDRAVLEREGVLVLGEAESAGTLSLVSDERLELAPPGAGAKAVDVRSGRAPSGQPAVPTRHDVTVVDGRTYRLGGLPRLLVTSGGGSRLGLLPRPPITVIRAPEALTRTQRASVNDAITDYQLDTAPAGRSSSYLNVFVEVHSPDNAPNPLLLEALLTGSALLFSLFVVAVSLALAAAETRDERDVLTVVGAPPRTMWGTSGRKAVLVTALGGALAVPVGFLPVVVFTWASNPTPPLVFPWRATLLVLVAVPLVAGLVTTAGSALALRVRPVRISTMAFD